MTDFLIFNAIIIATMFLIAIIAGLSSKNKQNGREN